MTLREYIMLNTKQTMSAIQFYYYCKNLYYIEKGIDEDDFDVFSIK